MSSREEFAALLRADPASGFQSSSSSSPAKSKPAKPPQSPNNVSRSEHTPLLLSSLPSPPSNHLPPISPRNNNNKASSDVIAPPIRLAAPPSRKHLRSSSDFVVPSSASNHHPLNLNNTTTNTTNGLPPPHTSRHRSGSSSNNNSKPPLKAITSTPGTHGVLGIPLPPPKIIHRRIKSDLPKSFTRHSEGYKITKSDLLKNFPDPRWGGGGHRSKNRNVHRRGLSSGGDLLETLRESGTDSGVNGRMHPLYGSIGNEYSDNDVQCTTAGRGHARSHSNASNRIHHARTKSDMSLTSIVTDVAKSALVKEVTEGGTVRFQLPKDNFRILMDCSLGE